MEPPFYLPSLLTIHPWCAHSSIPSHHSQQHLILLTKQLLTSLLNSPLVSDFLVGSATIASDFFYRRIDDVKKYVTSLLDNITDQQTRLRLFSQCIIQKLPHLLSADFLFHLPTDNPNPPWEEWNGPLTSQHPLYHQSILLLAPYHGRHYPRHTRICHLNQSTGTTRWQSWSPLPRYTGCPSPRLCHYHGIRPKECSPRFPHPQGPPQLPHTSHNWCII